MFPSVYLEENLRLIIRKIEDFEKTFQVQKKIINIYLQSNIENSFIKSLFKKNQDNIELNDGLFLYISKNDKLISLDFSKYYQINSFKYLDQLSSAKKIDYSIDFP